MCSIWKCLTNYELEPVGTETMNAKIKNPENTSTVNLMKVKKKFSCLAKIWDSSVTICAITIVNLNKYVNKRLV